MPAAFVTVDEIRSAVGPSLVTSLYSDPVDGGASWDATHVEQDIEFASSMVQLYAAGVGYTVGDTLGTTSADAVLKLATIGAVIRLAFSRPDCRVPLPEGWETHPANVAYAHLLDGKLPLVGKTLDTAASVGGWQFSEPSATNLDAPMPRRTSRRNMAGF